MHDHHRGHNDEKPIACSLTAAELERRRALVEALSSSISATEPIDDGYRLTFEGADDILTDIVNLIRLERKCCPFLRFQLTAAPHEGELVLTLTGPAGTRQFLEVELGLGAR